MDQLATELCSKPQGTLPSDTENLKNACKEHCKVVELRSGNILEPKEVVGEDEPTEKKGSQPTVEVPTTKKLDAEKSDKSKKKRLSECETVTLTKECSAFLQNKLPSKLKDPRSFTIHCNINESYCGKALCDLGASINLMPKSIFKLLRIGEVRPTILTLQLVDRSLAYPQGKIKDVLVRVDKFIFLVDFIVLDFEADKKVPIILERPFLATGRMLIDVQKGEITI
ncbi:hypothetical protein EPI10_006704 [Gossypium australe]|uniref:Uncharacterized protein n=1 Tax=Gossypium australe TaxID=47621 RepID=A0A5B6WRY9_9ROSI|nr:hypothetical protein EPI10_006704 [Gossypium australe]